jgi:hypothetical protein
MKPKHRAKAVRNRTRVVQVPYVRGGKRQSIDVEVPDSGEPETVVIEDAAKFVQTLVDNNQLAFESGPLPPGATHQIEARPDGTRRLTRKRFTAN